MGLDIRVYQHLSKISQPYQGELNRLVVNNPTLFRGRELPLEDGATYEGGCVLTFSAGPYSTYNHWREKLAEIVGYKPVMYDDSRSKRSRCDAGAWACTSGPFWELINFSDCEGVLGPEVCRKLAKDFADYSTIAELETREFTDLYVLFAEAVTLASHNGAVKFT